MQRMVLGSADAEKLLEARHAGKARAGVSGDLGLTTIEAELLAEGARFPNGELLDWHHAEEIAARQGCFAVDGGQWRKIQAFSELTGRSYVLMATAGAPTVLHSGIPMHRIKDIDPWEDTKRKILAVSPVRGKVLDTTTGLGYTAIRAARTAVEVITVELDPAMLELARLNPWSAPLFETPNIVQIVGDAFEEVDRFDDRTFSRILHDPPTFSMAGELYSTEFYRRLCRVLKANGRLFHYVGNLASKRGRNLARGVSRRLYDAGFGRVVRHPQAFGLVAGK